MILSTLKCHFFTEFEMFWRINRRRENANSHLLLTAISFPQFVFFLSSWSCNNLSTAIKFACFAGFWGFYNQIVQLFYRHNMTEIYITTWLWFSLWLAFCILFFNVFRRTTILENQVFKKTYKNKVMNFLFIIPTFFHHYSSEVFSALSDRCFKLIFNFKKKTFLV